MSFFALITERIIASIILHIETAIEHEKNYMCVYLQRTHMIYYNKQCCFLTICNYASIIHVLAIHFSCIMFKDTRQGWNLEYCYMMRAPIE